MVTYRLAGTSLGHRRHLTLHLTRPSHPASLPGDVQRDDCWAAPPADSDGYAPLRATTGAVVQEVRALAGRATTAEAVGVARASIPAAAVSADVDEAEVAVVQVKSAAVGGARRETCKLDAAACRTPVGTSLSVERPRSAEQIAALSDAFLPNLDGGECHAVTRHSLGLPPHAPAPCAGRALLARCGSAAEEAEDGEEETEAGVCLFLPLAPPRSAAPPPAEGRNGTNRSSNHSNAISVYNLSDFALQSRFTTNDDGANDDGDDDPCGGVCPQGVCDSVDDAGKPECGDCAECMAGGGRRRLRRRRWLATVVEEEGSGGGPRFRVGRRLGRRQRRGGSGDGGSGGGRTTRTRRRVRPLLSFADDSGRR